MLLCPFTVFIEFTAVFVELKVLNARARAQSEARAEPSEAVSEACAAGTLSASI